MQNKIEYSIIKTLVYSDIFEFPLKRNEIFKYFVGKKTSKTEIYSTILSMVEKGIIGKSGDFYFLIGNKNLPSMRRAKRKESKRKLRIARNIIKSISHIPTIKLIGISGSLSVENADRKDDIDLFIVTSRNTLWISRFLINALLVLKGVKRSKKDAFGIDMICPNMFLSEDSLKLDENIFVAHEIAQVKPIYVKNRMYEKFINANSWVLKIMPHSIRVTKTKVQIEDSSNFLNFIDSLFYKFQYYYMKHGITSEKISENMALFHPKDKTKYVIDLYRNKCQKYWKFAQKNKHFKPRKNPNLASKYTLGY